MHGVTMKFLELFVLEEKGRTKFPNETASRVDSSCPRYGHLASFCQTRWQAVGWNNVRFSL